MCVLERKIQKPNSVHIIYVTLCMLNVCGGCWCRFHPSTAIQHKTVSLFVIVFITVFFLLSYCGGDCHTFSSPIYIIGLFTLIRENHLELTSWYIHMYILIFSAEERKKMETKERKRRVERVRKMN